MGVQEDRITPINNTFCYAMRAVLGMLIVNPSSGETFQVEVLALLLHSIFAIMVSRGFGKTSDNGVWI